MIASKCQVAAGMHPRIDGFLAATYKQLLNHYLSYLSGSWSPWEGFGLG